jgi:hypothetical protein
MKTGKFKVFNTLLDWFEEFRLFHRKDGKVVKEGDDLLAAKRDDASLCRADLPEERTAAPAWILGSIRHRLDERLGCYHLAWGVCGLPPGVPIQSARMYGGSGCGAFGGRVNSPSVRSRLGGVPQRL